MTNINRLLIKCPTYKEAFTLRRALIDLGINWWGVRNLIGIKEIEQWKKYWNRYQEKTIYVFNNNQLRFGNIDTVHTRLNLTTYCEISLQNFIKKYVLKSDKND